MKYYEDPYAIGTENYHKVSPFHHLIITDGVKAMCEKLECFWLIDEIAFMMAKKKEDFMVVYLRKNNDSSCAITFEDGNGKVLNYEKIPFTDIKENVKLFIEKGEDYFVAMLPTEY